jgi:chemotaxis signal transduction protein
MKPSKFLIFKIDDQHYVVKNHCVVDIVGNSFAYQRGNTQKCGVRFNGKDVDVLDLKKKNNVTQPDLAYNSILILEVGVGKSKDLIGLGFNEVVEIVPFEEFLLNSNVPFSDINPVDPENTVLSYKNKNVILLSSDDLLRNHIAESGKKHQYSFIPN